MLEDILPASRSSLLTPLLNRQLWVFPLIWSLTLTVLQQYNVLAFHFFAEFFPIVISITMFFAIWWMRVFKENTFLTFIACGYIWIAGLDVVHVLTFEGLSIFVEGGANLTTQFWVTTRFVEALLLFVAPFAAAKTYNGHQLLTAFGVIAIALPVLIFSGSLPATYIEGVGLTDFKIYSEYIIIIILAAALFSTWKYREFTNFEERVLISAAIFFTICAELSFTLFVETHDIPVLLGHIFKVLSYWMIFHAIVVFNIKAPLAELNEFRSALDTVIGGVTILDAETLEIKYVNQNVARRVGKSVASIIGQTPKFISSDFNVDEFRKLTKPLVYGTTDSITYNRHSVNDAGTRSFREITLQLLDEGQAYPRFISVSRDLDARQQMKLAQAELAFQKLAIDEHAIVSIADAEGKITYINDKLCAVSGFSREELLGRNHNILKSDEHSYEFYNDMWETISAGRPWQGEIMNRKKDGGHYWVLSTIFPQLSSEEKPVSYIGICTDITQRKDAENEILRFKKTLDSSSDGVVMCWVETLEIDYANNTAIGWSAEGQGSLHGMKLTDAFQPFNNRNFLKGIRSLLTGEQTSLTFENTFIMPSGEEHYLEIVLQILKGEGDLDRFVIIARDITDRKKTEIELQRFNTTTELSQDAIFFASLNDQKIFYANEAASRYIGYSKKELCEMTAADIRTKTDNKEFQSMMSQLQKGDVMSVSFESEHMHKNGTIIPVEINLQIIESKGEKSHILSTVKNLTELKKSDEKIRQLQVTVDSMTDPVCMFWVDNLEYFYANRATLDFNGYSIEEMIGLTPLELFEGLNRIEFEARYEKLFTGEQVSITFDFERHDRHGNVSEVEFFAQMITPPDGRSYILEIFHDISERKKIEQAKSEFISTVSHELRTPLTSIKGVLGLIRGGVIEISAEVLLPLIENAYENSNRLESLINDILDLEKIADGSMEFDLEPLNVDLLIEEAIDANKGFGDQHGVEFCFGPVRGRHIINGDKGRMMQVMANLMSNAAKFSPKGSRVEISCTRKGGNICIWVKDTGCGIPNVAQASIFERFTQVDSSDQREKGGTGLGLSISKTIIEGHGGTIQFNSKVGVGTTFCVELPEMDIKGETQMVRTEN